MLHSRLDSRSEKFVLGVAPDIEIAFAGTTRAAAATLPTRAAAATPPTAGATGTLLRRKNKSQNENESQNESRTE